MKPVPLSEIEMEFLRANAFVAALKVAMAPMRSNVDASSRDARHLMDRVLQAWAVELSGLAPGVAGEGR